MNLSEDQLVAWRRRALDQQLPAAGFPAGSDKPSLIYLWATMVLAAAIVLGFAVNSQRGVPPAVVSSQKDNVSKVASSVRLTINHSVEDLNQRVSARSPSMPDPEFLKQLVGDGTIWNRAAIVEIASRRPLATHGPGMPMELMPPALPVNETFTITTPEGPALVRSIGLDPSRALLAAQPLDIDEIRLAPDARQGVFLITPDGKSTLMQGVSAVGEAHLPTVFRGLAQAKSVEGHPIRVTEWSNKQLVVSSAPVGETGATVATLIVAKETGGTSTGQGVLLGVTLLAMAVPGFLLMRLALVRPVRSLLKQAKANACGDVPTRRRPLRVAEAHRIARALTLASGSNSATGQRGWWRWRWRPTVTQGLILATVVALLWPAAAVAVTLREPEPVIPAQLVKDEESRAEAASTLMGKAMNNGLSTVVRLSQLAETAQPDQMSPLLEQELADKQRFRSLYMMDSNGSVVSSAGRKPLRNEPLKGESGIDLDNETARVPVVYAFRVAPNGVAVVGEFDIDYLLGMLREVDGQVRVVDEDLRTVFDSQGFRAFQELKGNAREAAAQALKGGTVGLAETPGGRPVLIAAAGVNKPITVSSLKWSLVVEQDLAGLRLPESDGRRWTLLVAGAAAGVVLLSQVWQYFVFARPLRRLASDADRIREGSAEVPIPPQRHDDVGALAMCLEICRQVRHTGSSRLGGATRLRGTEEDCTVVLPAVPQQPDADRAAPSPGDRDERG